MKSKPLVYKECDVENVVWRLKKFSSRYANYDQFLLAFLKAIDPKNTGFVGIEDLAAGIKTFDANLTY